MTPAERVAWALADRLPGLRAAAMAEHRAFIEAVDAALEIGDERWIVEAVLAMGGLAGARNGHAVVVWRLRQLPRHEAAGRAVEAERAIERQLDSPTLRAARDAETRGAVLAIQVQRGAVTHEEALVTLETEHASHLDVALDAFEGYLSHAGDPSVSSADDEVPVHPSPRTPG